jgi:hypothetical protein
VVDALASAYDEVRDGLGFRKTPDVYGAFPSDPYSHTPRGRGAQQPGMTGQVKEEILTRLGELGIEVGNGQLRFVPRLLRREEFFAKPHRFDYVNFGGQETRWEMGANCIGFTYCQTPICYQLSESDEIYIEWKDSRRERIGANALSAETSASIFGRSGEILRLTVLLDGRKLK